MTFKNFLQETNNIQSLEAFLGALAYVNLNQHYSYSKKNHDNAFNEINTYNIKLSIDNDNILLSSTHNIGINFLKELTEQEDNFVINKNHFIKDLFNYLIDSNFNIRDIERSIILIDPNGHFTSNFNILNSFINFEDNIERIEECIANAIYLSLTENIENQNEKIIISYEIIEDAANNLLSFLPFYQYDNNNFNNNVLNKIRSKCSNIYNTDDYSKFYFACVVNKYYECPSRKDFKIKMSELYKLQDLNFVKYTSKYIPSCDKADTILGEIARAYQHIIYRILNDGDCPIYDSPNMLSLYNLSRLLDIYLYDEFNEYKNLENYTLKIVCDELKIDIKDLFDIEPFGNYLVQTDLLHAYNLSECADSGNSDITSAMIVLIFASFFDWLFKNKKESLDKLSETNNKYDSRLKAI